MSKIYYIVANNGEPKPTWEEIVCDKVDVHPSGLVCFYVEDELTIAYNLAQGEALIYYGEEK